MPNDHRMPIINHLANDLHKHLNELENLYSTVKLIFYLNYSFFSFLFKRFLKVQINVI
jgi:hypothetical protein